jgi:hypothetical protein
MIRSLSPSSPCPITWRNRAVPLAGHLAPPPPDAYRWTPRPAPPAPSSSRYAPRCSISLSPLFHFPPHCSLALVGPDVIRRPKSERFRCPDCPAGSRFLGEDLMWSSGAGSGVPQLLRGSLYVHSFISIFDDFSGVRFGRGSLVVFCSRCIYLQEILVWHYVFLLRMNGLNMKRVNLQSFTTFCTGYLFLVRFDFICEKEHFCDCKKASLD